MACFDLQPNEARYTVYKGFVERLLRAAQKVFGAECSS